MKSADIKRFLTTVIATGLQNNRFAKTFVTHFDKLDLSKKDKFYESILPYYLSFDDDGFLYDHNEFNANKISASDLRIQAIRLSNVRGIPEQKEKLDYGLDFYKDGNFQSKVLLGPNGTGKSSIYDAIEYIYTNQIGEWNLRCEDSSLKSKSPIDFLGHFNNSPYAKLSTPSGQFTIERTIHDAKDSFQPLFDSSILFVNDYSIFSKGRKDYFGDETNSNSFHFLIASTLGLQDYLSVNTFLKTFAEYKRTTESRERTKYLTEKSDLENRISELVKQYHLKETQLKELNTGDREKYVRESNSLVEKVNHLHQQVLASLTSTKNDISKAIEAYQKNLSKFDQIKVGDNSKYETQFLTIGLSVLPYYEDCPFCLNSKLNKDNIKHSAEKRLENNKETAESIEKLQNSVYEVANVIGNTLKEALELKNKLQAQNNLISSTVEFDKIFNFNNELITVLERTLLDKTDYLNRLLRILRDNSLSDSSEYLRKNLTSDPSFFLHDLPDFPVVIENMLTEREKRIAELKHSLESTSNLSSIQSFTTLENELRSIKEIISASQNRIKSIDESLAKLENQIKIFHKLRIEATQFAEKVDFEVNKIVANTIEPIKESIETIVSEYFKDEGIRIEIDFREKVISTEDDIRSKYVIAKVISIDKSNGGILAEIPPTKYFNTFRCRLFAAIVNISLSIVARKKFGINTPLVIDDIFYASDYSNRNSFTAFLTKLILIFKKFNSEMPLQILLFTHDDIVFDSTIDAFQSLASEEDDTDEQKKWINELKKGISFERLFPPVETEATPTASPFGDFWNLAVNIPFQISTGALLTLKEN